VKRIGRYDIERMLGQGGMGEVYLARDSVLGRQVAVKVLKQDLGIPEDVVSALLSRMRQEARAAAALSHPNIVVLHDMGEDDEVGLFLVFEFIEGPTLRDRISLGPLPPAEVAKLARSLGDALSHAHAAGVIHRDIKPENVMMARTGAKICDLGVARIKSSKLTRAGTILGTPAYSAPEALANSEFSPASDQFSLAATLYEALSGCRAFEGTDALELATRITKEDPAPLEGAKLARADRVLARAMSKDRSRRYPSCAAFGEALARSLEEPEDKARVPLRTEPPAPARRWTNLLIGAAVIAAFVAYVVSRKVPDPRVEEPKPASSAIKDAGPDAKKDAR
jgi:serine/threonine-protein kinase